MEPIDWLVDKILPVGLSILGAPSKYYKSYMALGLCVAICQGAKFLGFDCTKHDCLYFDLESTKRRPKNRLDQIVGTGTKKPDNLHIITGDQSPGRIGEGFEEQVEYQLQKYPNIKLIVIDVFQLIRQPAKRNQTGYDRDYEDFRALKQIVDKHDIGVLLIHHTRKMKDPSDVFNELSGSTGMLGAQDCAWLISKKDRSDNEATLHITGRDLDNRDLKIEFDKKFFQWRYIGTEEEVEARRRETAYMQSPIRETIIKLVGQGSGHWEGRSEEIKNASKYLSQEIYEDVRNIGKFIREYSDLLQGIDGVNAIPGNTKTRKWKFNDTNATNNIDATNDTNATQMKLRYQMSKSCSCVFFVFGVGNAERSIEFMHHGVVKWFKTVKGYGFIAGDDGKEIFVHHSDILMNGFRNLEVGQRVSYQIEQTEKGNKAVNVVVE